MIVATFVLAVLTTVGFLLWALQMARTERDEAVFESVSDSTNVSDRHEKDGPA